MNGDHHMLWPVSGDYHERPFERHDRRLASAWKRDNLAVFLRIDSYFDVLRNSKVNYREMEGGSPENRGGMG